MEELGSWPIIVGALFGLIALGIGALAVPNHPDRVIAAKVFFILAALIWGVKIAMWGIFTEKGVASRLGICFFFFGIVGWGLMEGFRFARRALTPATDSSKEGIIVQPPPDKVIDVFDLFRRAYESHKDKLGKPKNQAETLRTAYFAEHQHAKVIWIENLGELRLLGFDSKWRSIPDQWTGDATFYDEECNRKRFGTPEEFYPPYGGVAVRWANDKKSVEWIGWKLWDCGYHEGVTYVQRFDHGCIVGAFRRATEDKDGSQLFILFDDHEWAAKTISSESPPCARPRNPYVENPPCDKVVPISTPRSDKDR